MRLTVTDDDGASSTSDITVPVGLSSLPPVANAGGPYRGVAGVPLGFDGRGSFDTDDGLQSWDWNFGDGTPARKGRRKDHAYAEPGRYPVTLRVTDSGGDTDVAVTWAEIGRGQRAPHADAGGPYRGIAGSEVALNGAASVGVGALSYEWNFGDRTDSGTGSNPVHVFSEPGSYFVTLEIVDEQGVADSAVTTVFIQAPN